MRTLVIEGSGSLRSVALCRWTPEGEYRVHAEACAEALRGGPLVSLVREVLSRARLEPAEVERLAVGAGPGSLAGIRSTMALAIGWSVARGIPAIGLSSLQGIASLARFEGRRGRLLCLVRSRSWHGALYRVDPDGLRELSPPAPVPPERMATLDRECDAVIGPLLPEDPLPVPAEAIAPTAGALGWLADPGGPDRSLPLEPLIVDPVRFDPKPGPAPCLQG